MPAAQAMVSIYDIGLIRGFAIYEALTTHNGKPFMLAEHLERFHRSAEAIHLKIPINDAQIAEVLNDLIVANKFKETNFKFVLTGGQTVAGIDYDYNSPTFYILAEEFSALPAYYLEKGCSLITYEFQRQYPEYKTTNYITAVMVQEKRKAAEALEVLYTWQGKISECAASNFMIIKNGVLITPKEGVLGGITRKVVLDLARKNTIPVEERDLAVSELATADEALLTSSFKEVVPVTKIDGKPIAGGAVGPVTKKILALFQEFTKKY
jgi:D-amino acid aminotransferase